MSGQITVSLPDGSPLELPEGTTGAEVAAAVGPRLARAAVAVRVDGRDADLTAPVPDGVSAPAESPAR